jgi:hypothetical protein
MQLSFHALPIGSDGVAQIWPRRCATRWIKQASSKCIIYLFSIASKILSNL